MYFRIYGLLKTWLDQCLKTPVSEDSAKSRMVNDTSLVNIFKKEMTLIADVFPKLRNPKNVVRSMS